MDMQVWNDESLHFECSISLVEILKENQLENKYVQRLLKQIIDLLKMYTKKEMDEIY